MTVDMSMAAPPMVERVELRMDSAQYVQEASRAERATTGLIRTVDQLVQRLDGLTTRAGRSMQAVGLGATAGITGTVAVAARYQQQMSPVEASQQLRGEPVGKVSDKVDDLARVLPVARAELGSMAQILSDMGETTPRRIGEITEQMTRLSAVTGETIPGLTRQFAEYQRTAGTVQDPSRFASSLAYVSRERGVSAGGTLQFAEAISPLSRPAGLSNQEVLGISAAFQSAGADGYRAANAFNRVLADIVRLSQEGSPELAKFANLVGVTSEEFAKMDRADAIIGVFEGISAQGPEAIRTLDKLGLDGVRTASSIQAVANQQGGLRKAVADAGIGANSQDLFQDASTEALSGLNDELAKTKNLLEESAKTIGDSFIGGFETAAKAGNAVLTVVNDIVKALATPIAIGAGALAVGGLAGGSALAGYKGLATASGALWAANSTPVRGAVGAFREGRRFAGTPEAGGYMSRINSGELTGWRAGLVQRAVGLGTYFPAGGAADGEARAGRMSAVASQVGRAPVRGANWWFRGMADMYRVADVAGVDRPSMIGGDAKGLPVRQRLRGVGEWQRQMRAEGPQLLKAMASGDTSKVDELTKSIKGNVEEAKKLNQSQGSLRRDMGTLGRSFTASGYQAARSVGRTAAGIGGGLASSIGGPMLAIAGGAMLYNEARTAAQESGAVTEWQGNPLAALREELGLSVSALGSFTDGVKSATQALPTPTDTGEFTAQEAAYARATATEAVTPGVGGLQSAAQAAAFLAAYGPTQPEAEAQQGLRIDVGRVLGENPTRSAMDQAQGMTQLEGLQELVGSVTDLGGGFRRWFAKEGPLGPIPLMGPMALNEGERDRLNLSTGLVNQIRDTELAKGGERASTQAALPALLTILEETGRAGVAGVTDAVVENLVQSELVPGGFRGTTFQTKFDKSGDVVEAFLGTLEKGGAEAQEFARYLQEGGFVLSTSLSEIEQQLRKFRAADQGTARYGQLEGNALYEAATFAAETRPGPVSESLAAPGDPNLAFTAMQDLAKKALMLGGSFNAADRELQELQAGLGNTTDDLYQLAQSARGLISAQRERTIVQEGREARLGIRADVVEQQLEIPADKRNPETWGQDTQGAYDAFKQEEESYRQFLVSLRAAQDNYEVQTARQLEDVQTSRARSEEDFRIQQAHALEDYWISRNRAEQQYELAASRQRQDFRISQARAEEDFRRSQARAQQDYQRSRARAVQDFTRQTMRAQQDFARQMQRSNEDLAASFYDPFKRAGAQYTYGAGSLLVNLERQNELIQQQVRDVNKLRAAGLNQDVVQQLDLLNPNNRQQVGRLAANAEADPSLIQQFNQSIEGRLDLAEGITFNASNETYKRAREDFNRAQKRASEDFLRAQARSAQDFARQMSRSVQDFTKQTSRAVEDNRRSVSRMAEDFRIAAAQAEEDFLRAATRAEDAHRRALDRMAEDVRRSLTRAKEDLVRLAKEYTGSVEKLARETSSWLRKYMPGVGDQVATQIDRVSAKVSELNRKYSNLFKSQSENAAEYLRWLKRLEDQEVIRFSNRAAAGGGSGGRNSDGQLSQSGAGKGTILPKGSYFFSRGPSGHGYNAVDLGAAAGTPIRSPWAGLAISAWDKYFGNYTRVRGGNGLTFLAAHQMTPGASGRVSAGSVIGRVGSTGNSTGNHLHAEVYRTGTARDAGGTRVGLLNPASYLKYDTGGVLEHGMGAINLSRKPEAILTNDQWSSIERLGKALVSQETAKMAITRPLAAPTYNTWIDQSMHISGDMKFVDPRNARELMESLSQEKRKRRMVRGAGFNG